MIVTGAVHGNSNIWLMHASSLTFSNNVTASGAISLTNMPGDYHIVHRAESPGPVCAGSWR
jgi:hypothetical protein